MRTVTRCNTCGEVVHDCPDGICSEKKLLWLVRAHQWERHGGEPPEGLP